MNDVSTNLSRGFLNKKLAALTFLSVIVFTIAAAHWPRLYSFAAQSTETSGHSFFRVPLRLDDDVMITLRSGYMMERTGKPSFNRSDVAQPSTSYAAPYVFWWCWRYFKGEGAVYVFAGLGLLCAAWTVACIAGYSQPTSWAIFLTCALCLTTTYRLYSLMGWDHVFQAACITTATCLCLSRSFGYKRAAAIALLLALGTAFRPDGALLSVGVLTCMWLHRKRASLLGGLLYSAIMIIMLGVNYHQFHHLTPTTARLKLGAAPSIGYMVRYAMMNGVLAYSTLTLFLALLVVAFGLRRRVAKMHATPIIVSCVITVGFALYNSDYFPGARMAWTSTCVLAAVVSIASRDLPMLRFATMDDFVRSQFRGRRGRLFAGVLVIACAVAAAALTTRKLKDATISFRTLAEDRVAQQDVIARWMASHLQPKDGSLGFFFLGVSYDLPDFEIADFMGKADETIANLQARSAPPGHNKWDLDRTLKKWNPQAIVPPGPVDPNLPETRANSHRHAPDLLLNEAVLRDYTYCYLPTDSSNYKDSWGFFLRRDIAVRYAGELFCNRN